MGTVRRLGAIRFILVGAVSACFAATAIAGAEDDYKAAQKAYADGDIITAMPLYKKAADAGYAPAQADLSSLLLQSEYYKQAAEYALKAANQGNALGEFYLGRIYADGIATKKNPALAREWFTKSALQGYPGALDVMAEAYVHAGLGLTQQDVNSPETLKWLKLSADKGYLQAVMELVRAYRFGIYGATKDPEQMKLWEAKAKTIMAPPKPGAKPAAGATDAKKVAAGDATGGAAAPAPVAATKDAH